jgi:hypothetical protein
MPGRDGSFRVIAGHRDRNPYVLVTSCALLNDPLGARGRYAPQASRRGARAFDVNLLLTMRLLDNLVAQLGISVMEQALQDRIRQRAYELWYSGGRVEGQADNHWLAAEREVLSEMSREIAVVETVSAKPPRRKRRPTIGGWQHKKEAS